MSHFFLILFLNLSNNNKICAILQAFTSMSRAVFLDASDLEFASDIKGIYCPSKKSRPMIYSKFQYELGQDFLDILFIGED